MHNMKCARARLHVMWHTHTICNRMHMPPSTTIHNGAHERFVVVERRTAVVAARVVTATTIKVYAHASVLHACAPWARV